MRGVANPTPLLKNTCMRLWLLFVSLDAAAGACVDHAFNFSMRVVKKRVACTCSWWRCVLPVPRALFQQIQFLLI